MNQDKYYSELLEELKTTIQQARLRAIVNVNTQMIKMYWDIGKSILARQNDKGWGAKVIDNLAKDLKTEFPDLKGISTRNLKYMRKFAFEYQDFAFVQGKLAQISWYHHITLIDKIKEQSMRIWYAQKVVEHGWTRDVMVHQIEANAHKVFGKLPNNFPAVLPLEQSEAVTNLLKDEYIFDFIAQNDIKFERELEGELVQNMTKFLLELGKGFAFVGKQYHIEVGGQDFYIDLLFYHFKLKCFVVLELKVDDFKPEYVGKLNFYQSVVDDLVKDNKDAPTIGLLLCKTKNDVVVEYALQKLDRPMGIASYQLTKQVPENLKDSLPSPQELQQAAKKKR
ncbi:MAG: DUF1016 domain-containing protein [Cytophagia bacterium]|nr:MAG: DUF1016 domain-containing protein [Cytophagales bacterium]TAG07152.1 MAG: DUF1016 domain-containing protein [Cytophagia bacterium]TAG44377.1 MAG: DUF1016 domain-containing protein [Cytophagia bacterium]